MTRDELYHKLIKDLNIIFEDQPLEEVDFVFRPYSTTYYGRYFPVRPDKGRTKPKIYIYPYSDTKGNFMKYEEILDTAIHEFIHHIQYSDPRFKRKKGVMHDPQFWVLYNHYKEKGGVMCEKAI